MAALFFCVPSVFDRLDLEVPDTDPGDGNREPNGEAVRGDPKEAVSKVPAREQEQHTRQPQLAEEGKRSKAR